jgi:hypothetical protein
MTLSQGYRMVQAAKQPCLDYPYIGIPDEEEDTILTGLNYDTEKIPNIHS